MSNPVLLDIIQHTGEPISGARLNLNAPTIPGFIAIENPHIRHSTKYIRLGNIASFSILDQEIENVVGSFKDASKGRVLTKPDAYI